MGARGAKVKESLRGGTSPFVGLRLRSGDDPSEIRIFRGVAAPIRRFALLALSATRLALTDAVLLLLLSLALGERHTPSVHSLFGSLAFVHDHRSEPVNAGVLAELPQRLGLDLPDPLAREVEETPDLLQCALGISSDAEAHAQNLLFAGAQRAQHPPRLLLHLCCYRAIDRR